MTEHDHEVMLKHWNDLCSCIRNHNNDVLSKKIKQLSDLDDSIQNSILQFVKDQKNSLLMVAILSRNMHAFNALINHAVNFFSL